MKKQYFCSEFENKYCKMNLYGIIGAIGLLPKYEAAKARLAAVEVKMKAMQAHILAYDEVKGSIDLHPDQNKRLDGVDVSGLLRIQGKLSKACVDGVVTIANSSSDRSYLISRVSASYTVLGTKVSNYVPLGITEPFVLAPGDVATVNMSAAAPVVLFVNDAKRAEFENQVRGMKQVANIATANIQFYYSDPSGVATPIRAIYADVPVSVSYNNIIMSHNTMMDPLAGYED